LNELYRFDRKQLDKDLGGVVIDTFLFSSGFRNSPTIPTRLPKSSNNGRERTRNAIAPYCCVISKRSIIESPKYIHFERKMLFRNVPGKRHISLRLCKLCQCINIFVYQHTTYKLEYLSYTIWFSNLSRFVSYFSLVSLFLVKRKKNVPTSLLMCTHYGGKQEKYITNELIHV